MPVKNVAAAPVDMTPWRHANACAVSLISCVLALYLLFSPVGLVGGLSMLFTLSIGMLVVINIVVWSWSVRRAYE